jgi:hypothetical protein
LVVEIHGDGSMRDVVVGVKTWIPLLKYGAVYHRTRIAYVVDQGHIIG